MTDLARRAALKFFTLTGFGAGLDFALPKASSGALVSTESAQCVSGDAPPLEWWRRDRLQGLKLYDHNGLPGEPMPAHIAALRSVRPWAKLVIARHYEDERRTFIEKLEERLSR